MTKDKHMLNLRPFRRALRGLVGQVLGYQVRDGFGSTLVPLFDRVLRSGRVTDDELSDAMGHRGQGNADEDALMAQAQALGPLVFPPAGRNGKSTALVSLRGVALYDLELQPYAFSTLALAQTITALGNNPDVGTILLDIDSPGGVVTGVMEAADSIWAARQRGTRVVALVNPLAASAAYWIASQADEIVAVPSAEVGSIGVFTLHAECAAMLEDAGIKATFIFAGDHKVEGNPLEPLSAETREFIQSQVDFTYKNFVKAVARGRGITTTKVNRDFGQGRTFFATDALRMGLIDKIQSIDSTFTRLGIAGDPQAFRADGGSAEPAVAQDDPDPEKLSTRLGDFVKGDRDTNDPEPVILVTAVCVDEENSCYPAGTKLQFPAGTMPNGWVLEEFYTAPEPEAESVASKSRARRLAILRAG